MTHTKKKFVSNIQLDFSIGDIDPEGKFAPKKIDFNEYDQAFLQTEDNKVIMGFLYMNKDTPIIIPEPDPTILYFTSAENSLLEILNLQSEILNLTGLNNSEKIANLFYTFFQLSSNFVINLFASLEAFNNGIIPNDFTHRIKRKLYDSNKIQRFLKFDTKVREVVPKIFEKSFIEDHPGKFENLNKMKKLRDNVIHMKNYSESFSASYRELFRDYLSFNFESAFNDTKEYVNYYKPNWIENCDCGN